MTSVSLRAQYAPLLTIAIPTYNRSDRLVRLLQHLAPQLVGEARVELLVSDNASPDETPSVLERFRQQGLVFRYIRNESNIGPDANFQQCFEEAAGKYVWIFGDDDLIVPDGVAAILSVLEQDDFDIVHLLGRRYVEGTALRPLGRAPRVKVYKTPKSFALKTHIYLTFITANIVNKQKVDSVPHRPFSELNGTNLGQLAWTYIAVRNLRKGACILDKVIEAGDDYRGGYLLFRVFGPNLREVTENWLVAPELVRIVMNGTLQIFFPDYVLRSKIRPHEFDDRSPEDLLYSTFSSNYRYHLFVYPLLKLPGTLGRGWKFLSRVVNRLDRAVGYPLLR